MAGANAFQVEGIVTAVLPKQLFRVRLANGHELTAYALGAAKRTFAARAGDTVKLQMSPYDLSEGRIVVETKTDLQ
ncbi:MAG TPA: translation initiation factor IF-1 [Verrucomicrobiae bacterium]|nr:translation initiation factor IF-1 [Verrucomicrobiae bacterium]